MDFIKSEMLVHRLFCLQNELQLWDVTWENLINGVLEESLQDILIKKAFKKNKLYKLLFYKMTCIRMIVVLLGPGKGCLPPAATSCCVPPRPVLCNEPPTNLGHPTAQLPHCPHLQTHPHLHTSTLLPTPFPGLLGWGATALSPIRTEILGEALI